MNIAHIIAQMEELSSQVAFASDKAERALKASAAYGYQQSLGSVQTPIGGGLIIPETVTTDQLQDALITELKLADDAVTAAKLAVDAVTADAIATGSITETKIADDAISTPKLQAGSVITAKIAANAITANEIAANAVTAVKINAGAVTATAIAASAVVAGKIDANAVTTATIAANAITAAKLEATLVLASTITTASSGSRVQIDSTGIKAYNASTQRVQILNDGSGWFGSSTAFAWTTAGVVTTTGITIKSASGNARVEINSTGLKWYNSSGTQRGQILNDGSGWLGASGSFSWNTSGTVVMDGAFLTNSTVTANKVSGGTLGGGFNMGTSSITVNSTGRINFGSGDYLANDTLHFEVGSTDTAKIEIKNGSNTPYGELGGNADSAQSWMYLTARDGTNVQASLVAQGNGSATAVHLIARTGTSTGSYFWMDNSALLLSNYSLSTDYFRFGFNTNPGRLSMRGALYPGTGSAMQTTGYLDWDSGNTRGRWMGADFRFDQYVMLDQTGSRTSGTPGLSDKYIAFKNSSGTIWYVPAYSDTTFAD